MSLSQEGMAMPGDFPAEDVQMSGVEMESDDSEAETIIDEDLWEIPDSPGFTTAALPPLFLAEHDHFEGLGFEGYESTDELLGEDSGEAGLEVANFGLVSGLTGRQIIQYNMMVQAQDLQDAPNDHEETEDANAAPPTAAPALHSIPYRPAPRRNEPRRERPKYEDDDYDPEYDVANRLEETELDPEHDAPGQSQDTDMERDPEYFQRVSRFKNKSPLGASLPFLVFNNMLQDAGFGEKPLPGPVEGDLDDYVHPIFQQASWIREPRFGEGRINEDDLLWKRLKPALILATKMITDPSVMCWWYRALCGHQVVDKETGRTYMSDPGEMGAAGVQRVLSRMKCLVGRVRWSFESLLPPAPGHQTHALLARDLRTLDIHARPRLNVLGHNEPERPLYIGVHDHFRVFLLSDTYDVENEPCRVLRMNWFLAFTMTHELAHAYYASKAAKPRFKEPLFDLWDQQPELGWSWERSILGVGELQCFVDQLYGVWGIHWAMGCQSKEEPSITFDSMFRYPLDPLWLHSFFQRATWARLELASEAEKMTFWNPPQTTAAVTRAPLTRGDGYWAWMWVTADKPREHRLSLRYWQLKCEEWMKRCVYKKKMDRAKEKAAKNDPDYKPGARKAKKVKLARRASMPIAPQASQL